MAFCKRMWSVNNLLWKLHRKNFWPTTAHHYSWWTKWYTGCDPVDYSVGGLLKSQQTRIVFRHCDQMSCSGMRTVNRFGNRFYWLRSNVVRRYKTCQPFEEKIFWITIQCSAWAWEAWTVRRIVFSHCDPTTCSDTKSVNRSINSF